ncbi:hypothetical protein GCM10023335_28120 [Streptomyces siamensis]|uniref:Uncharacterized protein n=1 Tax=Streptomyces siamensis TaxID=1274986 RepID=A0ABP9IV07_9ACTN
MQASVESYTSPWWCTAPYIPSSARSRSSGFVEASPRNSPGTSSALPYACSIEAQPTSSIPLNTVSSPGIRQLIESVHHGTDSDVGKRAGRRPRAPWPES